jgi:hypothetical protein
VKRWRRTVRCGFPSGERGREGSGETGSERVDRGERERRVYPR